MPRRDITIRTTLALATDLGAIRMAGYQTKEGPLQRFRYFDRYALVYLLEGSGMYDDENGVAQRVTPGDLIIIWPGLGHRYGPEIGVDDSWYEYFLVFDGPIFDQWVNANHLDPSRPVCRLEPAALWQPRIEGVLNPQAPTTAAQALQEVSRLQVFLADALDWVSPSSAQTQSTWLTRAQDALAGHQPLKQVARQLYCSYPTFHRRFTKLAGITPGRYRARLRIEKACAMMHQSDRSDKQIAAELGFGDACHFSRSFKQALGISPRAYRRSLP